MLLKRKGSITVFICIVLAVLIPLCCMLMDITRYTLAVRQAQTAVKTCTESMLAAYDRQLKDQYGLFALYPRDAKAMEEEIFELLSENLNTGANADGVTDLYGFKVRKVEVVPFYNLSEPFVLKQQVAEFMKYRAPVQVIQEFYEKIKLMVGLMKEGDMVEQKMNLDKLMNDIRSSLVNLYFMLEKKLPQFNTVNGKPREALKDNMAASLKINTQNASREVEAANKEVNAIKEAQENYIGLYPSYLEAKENVDYAQSIVSGIDSQIQRKSSQLAKAEAKAENQESEQSDQTHINLLKAELADLTEQYTSASNSLGSAISSLNHWEGLISEYKSILDDKLSKVTASLTLAYEYNIESSEEINDLFRHIIKHEQFHSDLLAIIDEVAPKLEELEKESNKLLSETNDSDGSVADRIQGDVEKQIKCIKKETFTEIRVQLASNLAKLQQWKQACSDCIIAIDKGSADLEYVLLSAEAVKAEPQNKDNQYLGYGGFQNVETAAASLDAGLSDLKPLSEMKGIFEIPVYCLEPPPNEVERNSFQSWYRTRYYGLEAEAPPVEDDTELKQVREEVSGFAADVGQQGGEEEGAHNESADKNETPDEVDAAEENRPGPFERLSRLIELPSREGAKSSEEALRRIGKAIIESSENQAIDESPFDKPVEGLDTVNENEKNFFDYEIARIAELLNIIKNAVANGLEGMIESLYMNEYIVSAFKCASTGKYIEHDIGWGRPLDRTYFDNAEVEYVIFGRVKEEDNIGCAKRSIFAIRLVFNLLHVYTDPDKLAATLGLATTLAGWTIFGIPVVQNFLLISWAGLESYVDAEMLVKGQSVPLIKTSASWYLGMDNAVDSLKNIFLKDIREFVEQKIEQGVNDVSEAITESVTGIINSKIDEAFAPFEQGIGNVVDDVADAVTSEVSSLFSSNLLSDIQFDNLDSFAESLGSILNNYITDLSEKLKSMAQDKLSEFKSAVKERIRVLIFESSLYQGMVEKIKAVGNDLLNKGISAVEGQIDKAFGSVGKSRSNNIAGRLIMMDYVDYLRLMLLAVPAEKKALRTADLMELNMQEVSANYDLSVDNYNTYLYIKVELDMNTWFLPEEIFKSNDSGMITIEWSQGY